MLRSVAFNQNATLLKITLSRIYIFNLIKESKPASESALLQELASEKNLKWVQP